MNNQRSAWERLREAVDCAVLLEQSGYQLDSRDSTRRAQKWRRGPGEIIIVTREGRGWWDPLRSAAEHLGKGDVLALAQYLKPGSNFLDACENLRQLVGIAPELPERRPPYRSARLPWPVSLRWNARHRLSRGTETWTYLAVERCLPACVLLAGVQRDAIREGPRGSAWFAHRDQAGTLTGIEMRGPNWRSFSTGGQKALFQLPGGSGLPTRFTVSEAPIDALSLAAFEAIRPDTLYLATGGGMGPLTIGSLELLLAGLAQRADGQLIQATDADLAGERYAEQLAALAKQAGVRAERLRPPAGCKDWNDALKLRGRAAAG